MDEFIGKVVVLVCGRYVYIGLLVTTTPEDALLENVTTLMGLGEVTTEEEDARRLVPTNSGDWRVKLNQIESYGLLGDG